MVTVVLSPQPEIDELIARRRRLGLDGHDEVWEGSYHVAPEEHVRHGWTQAHLHARLIELADAVGLFVTAEFNLGTPQDHRVPDFAVHEHAPSGVWVPTALIVGEVLSPEDETWAKLPFYAARRVEEVFVADPVAHTVRVFVLDDGAYEETDRSPRLQATTEQLGAIRWPTA